MQRIKGSIRKAKEPEKEKGTNSDCQSVYFLSCFTGSFHEFQKSKPGKNVRSQSLFALFDKRIESSAKLEDSFSCDHEGLFELLKSSLCK